MEKVFLVSACRSAIGSFGGGLATVSPAELGSQVAKAALSQAGIGAAKGAKPQVHEVIVGNVLGAGHGMNLARQVALGAGLPVEVPAYAINKVCGSGLKSVALAASEIAMGNADVMLAGGVESMSQAGFVSLSSRWGARLGHAELKDLILQDGLTDVFHRYHMGITAENLAERFSISREAQDAFALRSQQRAAAAQAQGLFKQEIVPITLYKKGNPAGTFEKDEYPRPDSSQEALAKLSPAFKKDGTVTAGNASGINDGAAMVVLMSEQALEAYGGRALAEVIGSASAAVPPEHMGIGPVSAVQRLCERTGVALRDIDWIEANEAFAAQALAVGKELGWQEERVNPLGGAIALGHPIGASGTRILVTLVHQLQRTGKSLGLATLCVGGGQGVALLVRRC